MAGFHSQGAHQPAVIFNLMDMGGMLDRHVVSVVTVLPSGLEANRKGGSGKQSQQGVEPWPLSEINHHVDCNRADAPESGGEINNRYQNNLINTVEHAGHLEIGWAGEKDHGSVGKCRAEIGNRRTDEHGVSDSSRPEKTECLYLRRQCPLAPRMTQDRNGGDSRVAIQKMQHRASSFADHLFLVYLRNPAGKEFKHRGALLFAESIRHEPPSCPCEDPVRSYCPPAERMVCGASSVHCSCDECSSMYSRIS